MVKLGIAGWRVSAATFIYDFEGYLCSGLRFGAAIEAEVDRLGRQCEHLQRLPAWRCRGRWVEG